MKFSTSNQGKSQFCLKINLTDLKRVRSALAVVAQAVWWSGIVASGGGVLLVERKKIEERGRVKWGRIEERERQ